MGTDRQADRQSDRQAGRQTRASKDVASLEFICAARSNVNWFGHHGDSIAVPPKM